VRRNKVEVNGVGLTLQIRFDEPCRMFIFASINRPGRSGHYGSEDSSFCLRQATWVGRRGERWDIEVAHIHGWAIFGAPGEFMGVIARLDHELISGADRRLAGYFLAGKFPPPNSRHGTIL